MLDIHEAPRSTISSPEHYQLRSIISSPEHHQLSGAPLELIGLKWPGAFFGPPWSNSNKKLLRAPPSSPIQREAGGLKWLGAHPSPSTALTLRGAGPRPPDHFAAFCSNQAAMAEEQDEDWYRERPADETFYAEKAGARCVLLLLLPAGC